MSLIFSAGFPSTSKRSASFPGPIDPSSFPCFSNPAALKVAICNAFAAGIPAFTSSSSSRCSISPASASVPAKIGIPASYIRLVIRSMAGLPGLSLQFIQLLVLALPSLPQYREPLPWRPEQPVLIIEPNGLRLEGKSRHSKLGHMQFLLVILERHIRHSLQPSLTGRQKFQETALRLHQRSHQQRRLRPRSIVADIKSLYRAGSVLRSALPMRASLLEGKMFVHQRFQIIVPGNVRAQWQAVPADDARHRNLWSAATAIELDSAVDSAVRAKFVYFTSTNGVIRHVLVAKYFLRGSGPSPKQSSRANEKENCWAVYVHRSCILPPIHPSGQRLISAF